MFSLIVTKKKLFISAITKTEISLPSGVFSALYGEQVLDSYNDVNLRWISYDNWTYTNIFSGSISTIDIFKYFC